MPLNSGFYRVIDVDAGEENTVINAAWPVAVTGFCSGGYEKVINAVYELWSQVMPERAMACCFNLEYLLVGGRDARTDDRAVFMWYDWMVGGWGGRNGKDGANCTSPVFGVGLAVQPLEGQERLTPVLTTEHQIVPDSGGPGRFRGGVGVSKGGRLTEPEGAVMSYCCDRARSITWGIEGGLPSIPHGVWLTREGEDEAEFLGATFSNVDVGPGDLFTRPSAGGGGFGDPLERDPEAVVEDVADGYVTVERACIDYGVVVNEVDAELAAVRARLRRDREGAGADPRRARRLARGGPRAGGRALPRRRARTPWTRSGATGSSSTGAPASCWSGRPSSSGRCSSAAPSITGRAERAA